MSEIGKKKEINFGITDELKNFLKDWTEERTFESAENLHKEKQIGIEIKQAIVEIAMTELEKLEIELNKCRDDDEWFKLIKKIDKLSDLVRWY